MLWHNSIFSKRNDDMVTAWLQKTLLPHLTHLKQLLSSTCKQTLNRTQVNIPPPKNKNKRKTKRFNPQMRLLITTWGPSRIQSIKTQKKPWKLETPWEERAFFKWWPTLAMQNTIHSIQFNCWVQPSILSVGILLLECTGFPFCKVKFSQVFFIKALVGVEFYTNNRMTNLSLLLSYFVYTQVIKSFDGWLCAYQSFFFVHKGKQSAQVMCLSSQ